MAPIGRVRSWWFRYRLYPAGTALGHTLAVGSAARAPANLPESSLLGKGQAAMTDESDPYALPPDVETGRLRSLDQLHMFRGQPEDRFARVTRMALVALGVPMSAINLMERDNQWCKQFSGAGDPDFDVAPKPVCLPGDHRLAGPTASRRILR